MKSVVGVAETYFDTSDKLVCISSIPGVGLARVCHVKILQKINNISLKSVDFGDIEMDSDVHDAI